MKRILVVDDKASSRELVRTVLEHCGYEVIEAADGAEAVDKARESQPQLILLDLQMPALDGFGVIERLRREVGFAATPIVALTASAMHGDRLPSCAARWRAC
jgi:CheY-like chemotaxis protein